VGFLKFIFSFVFGPAFSFFKGVMDYRTQKAIIQGEVAKESIRANVELSHIKREMHRINMGWWATRWIVPLIAYPVIAWWICVWLDTIFAFPNWSVAAPPEPVYSWSGEIILSFFVIRGAEMVANTVTAWSTASTISDVVGRVFGRGKNK
jgi:hypothetical protein